MQQMLRFLMLMDWRMERAPTPHLNVVLEAAEVQSTRQSLLKVLSEVGGIRKGIDQDVLRGRRYVEG